MEYVCNTTIEGKAIIKGNTAKEPIRGAVSVFKKSAKHAKEEFFAKSSYDESIYELVEGDEVSATYTGPTGCFLSVKLVDIAQRGVFYQSNWLT